MRKVENPVSLIQETFAWHRRDLSSANRLPVGPETDPITGDNGPRTSAGRAPLRALQEKRGTDRTGRIRASATAMGKMIFADEAGGRREERAHRLVPGSCSPDFTPQKRDASRIAHFRNELPEDAAFAFSDFGSPTSLLVRVQVRKRRAL
ncbi:hypothetical protein SKAU_G00252400 [Synaphobranchus kaupii]|uniref:Uncharacterized protein n=1 Tax=Synaphobranchus kaupii TaxID=118154 RepID=A0A9Q1F3D6_SYNKA|nr:hypothetical protein SKAU_G00252400 [Synaphobranchus kaupii]